MGGSALVIHGSINDDLLKPRAVPRSILDRLLGRARTHVPTWSQIGRNRRVIDLPADPLKGLASAFRGYVESRLSPAWTATAWVLQYLRLDVINIYVRGEASGSERLEWYVQLTLSGSAGMSEVSAQLAVHWAERWYRENEGDLVSRYLKPYGFEPDARVKGAEDSAIFVPFGNAGYALFNPTPRPIDDEYPESRYFEIDAAALETLGEGERATALRALDEQLAPILPTGACCCQLCAPDFDVAAYEGLIPFR